MAWSVKAFFKIAFANASHTLHTCKVDNWMERGKCVIKLSVILIELTCTSKLLFGHMKSLTCMVYCYCVEYEAKNLLCKVKITKKAEKMYKTKWGTSIDTKISDSAWLNLSLHSMGEFTFCFNLFLLLKKVRVLLGVPFDVQCTVHTRLFFSRKLIHSLGVFRCSHLRLTIACNEWITIACNRMTPPKHLIS